MGAGEAEGANWKSISNRQSSHATRLREEVFERMFCWKLLVKQNKKTAFSLPTTTETLTPRNDVGIYGPKNQNVSVNTVRCTFALRVRPGLYHEYITRGCQVIL